MRNLILKWLFGTDKLKSYMDLLGESIKHHERCKKLLDDHGETIEVAKQSLAITQILLDICEKHGIDIEKEMKQIEQSAED